MENIPLRRADEDLTSPAFLAGERAGRWTIVSWAFPKLVVEISATEPDGTASRYRFNVELSNYPAAAPHVRIWDRQLDAPLSPTARPKGGHRVQTAFQPWQSDTVYRPWERISATHNNFHSLFPQLAWHPKRTLAFILEDIYGILNLNARVSRVRQAA
jgi:hypothetical protein